MQAFIDDSTEPPAFVLAGFLGRASDFAQLTDRWAVVLAKQPTLEYFKMSEAFAFQGQFLGWSVTDRDERLTDLVGIIKEHAMAGIYAMVRWDDFSEIMKGRIAKPLDNHYWLMYYSIITLAFEWEIENEIEETIDFVFDEQMHQSDEVQAHFAAFYALAPPRVKALFGNRPVHRNDIKARPLQAADMLAWHIHRRYCDREKGIEFDSPTMRTLNSIPHFDSTWTKERLQALVVDYEEKNRRSDMWSIYENQRAERQLPETITRNNLRLIARAEPNSCVVLSPFPAKATRRFRLVDNCPLSRTPHLHRRSGNECLAANSFSGSDAGLEPQR
jgi:hypothetical protein